jgi:hypothetical protein
MKLEFSSVKKYSQRVIIKRSFFFLLSLLLSFSGKAAYGQATAAKTEFHPAEITITSKVIKSVEPELFLGVNWSMEFRTHGLREIFNHHRREFANFLSAHGVRVLRYPGGGYCDWIFPGVPREKWYKQWGKYFGAPTRPDDWIELPEFLDFLKEGNLRGIIQINTRQYWDPVANEVRLVKGKNGLNIPPLLKAAKEIAEYLATKRDDHIEYYIQIGNEEFFTYTPGEYADIVFQIVPIIKKILPERKIIVTGQSLSAGYSKSYLIWTDQFLQILAQKGGQTWVDYISHHDYANKLKELTGNPPISTSSPQDEWRDYMAYDPSTASGWNRYIEGHPLDFQGKALPLSNKSPLALLSELLKKYGYQNTKIWITEYRNSWLSNRYSKALAGGLGNLNLLIGYLKSPDVAGAVIHNLLHGNRVSVKDNRPFMVWGFGIMEYAPYLEKKFIATPVLQALTLLSRVQGNEVLQILTTDPQLSVFCSRKGRSHYLLVLNQDVHADHQVSLRLPQFGDSWQISGRRLVWTSRSIGDYAVVYGSYDKISPIPISESSFSASQSSVLSFSPHSATVLEFQKN